MNTNEQLNYNGFTIKFNKDNQELISLTDMWKASGSEEFQRPYQWVRLVDTEKFIESLEKKFKRGHGTLLKSIKGKYGGTYAHWQLALAYAKYLSPEFHMWANEVVKERMEEDVDPVLGLSNNLARASIMAKRCIKLGMDEDTLIDRIAGVADNKLFKSACCRAGGPESLGVVTNTVYKAITGKNAKELQEHRNVKHTRDALTQLELRAVSFAETLLANRFIHVVRSNRYSLKDLAESTLAPLKSMLVLN
jgi:hypothetical protein